MTVVIGMMADSRQPKDPALPTTSYLLLCADTQATYAVLGGPIVAIHPSHGKIYELPHGFYAAFSDSYSWSHKVIMELHGRMLHLDMNSAAVRDLVRDEILESFKYAFSWYRHEILKHEVGITVDEYLHDEGLVAALRDKADALLREACIPAEIIVAGQTKCGPMLIKANTHTMEETTEFLISGSGADLATSWLKMRDQRSNMSVPRAGYHLLEAKRFAQLEETVGRKTQIVVIPPTGEAKIFPDDGESAMSKWIEIFGVKDTEELDSDHARFLFEQSTGLSLAHARSSSAK
jgi:hypothetical protein